MLNLPCLIKEHKNLCMCKKCYTFAGGNNVQRDNVQCTKEMNVRRRHNNVQRDNVQCTKEMNVRRRHNNVQRDNVQCTKEMNVRRRHNNVQRDNVQCTKGQCTMYKGDERSETFSTKSIFD